MEKHITEIKAKILSLMIEHDLSYVELKMSCNSDKSDLRGNIYMEEDVLEESDDENDTLRNLGLL